MRLIVRNLVIVLAALLIAAWSIIPPEKQLRLGKDLRGGVSMVYAVQLAPGESPGEIIPRVIDVIRNRIDPQGIMEISIVQQGRDRLEITMPLPSQRVKELRRAYEAELSRLDRTAITPAQLEPVLRMQGEQREEAMVRLAAGSPARLEMLRAGAAAGDAVRERRAELEAAQAALREAAGADEETIAELTGAVDFAVEATAEAEIAHDQARDALLKASLSGAEVRRALQLSPNDRRILDTATGRVEVLPSPRQQALERLEASYPEARDQLEAVLAAHEAYSRERTSLDDPADLERLLRGAGVLDFRIAIGPGEHPDEARLREELQERGPQNVRSSDANWYKLNQIDNWFNRVQELREIRRDPRAYFASRYGLVVEPYDGEYYALLWDTRGNRLTRAEGDWAVAAALQGRDQMGKPAIDFRMDPRGAILLTDLTSEHVSKQMAVLLDDQVYTAPTLRSTIGRSGQISGEFTQEELQYVIRVLAAGSLQAKLSPEPISVSTLGPDLGLDNLQKGMRAGIWAIAIVSVFMFVYYFWFGGIAVFALACNALLILGAMALGRAAFTLPGIAAAILTFGMAVDANVLIYERMREEFKRGADMRTAVRLGFQKAFSSIVDGNVTNLIVCVVLYYVGTQEIRGFAVIMSIGVITTLFTALVVSRLIFTILAEHVGWQHARMLPMVVPVIDRVSQTRVNWIGKRYLFFTMSAVYIGLGIAMIAIQGSTMLGTEFRGGTSVTLQFRDEQPGRPITLTRADVQDRVVTLARATPGLAALQNAEVLPIDPEADGVTSDRFRIKTTITEQREVVEAIQSVFAQELDARVPVEFDGAGAGTVREAPVYRLISNRGVLGEDIDRPKYRDDVRAYRGGAAIVLEGLHPAPTFQSLHDRLEQMRAQPEHSDTLGRARELRILEGDVQHVTSAVLLVRDPGLSVFDNEPRWESEVAGREWRLVRDALSSSSTLASVDSFSPAIAANFKAKAVVAVLLSFLLVSIYVWVRFGSVRYSLAAIIPLIHDALACVGIIALVEILFEWPVTQPFLLAVGLQPFKIDLNVVAALLTIIGFSINDTIVIMDRIREKRGKLDYASADIINGAVNECMSRTIITSFTTLLATVVLYVLAGEAIRGFAFTFMIGVLLGVFSTVAIAAPIVWDRKADRSGRGAAAAGIGRAGGRREVAVTGTA